MRRNLSKNKMLNISVIALFLAVSFAGCLENDDENIISPNDVVVNPVTLVAGEFQPLVISAKRDVSVFIPHMVVDPASNYLQNGTILDMRTGETKQLTILAPPRIDTAFIFLSNYGTEVWSIRNPSESWKDWVERGGINQEGLAVSRVEPEEYASFYTLNSTEEKAGKSVPIKIDLKREVSAAYTVDEGSLFSRGFVDGRTVFNSIARISDETPDILDPADGAVGYLDRWAGQGNLA